MRKPAYPAPLTAVTLISASALAYEILLVRIFAIVHWHHLVATAISLALLGYGASGTFLAITGPRIRRHFAPAFIANALLFVLSSLACVALAQRFPFDPQALTWERAQIFYLAGTFLILAIPFFAAANCVGLALWQFEDEIPRIYGVDLIGAGLGGLMLIGGLAILTPSEILFGVFLSGILVSASAALTLRWHLREVALIGIVLVIAIGLWGRPAIQPAPYKDLARAMATIGATIAHESSGVAGIVSVVHNDQVPVRQAPGLSLHASSLPPKQLGVFVDGDASGAIALSATSEDSSAYLQYLISALPYILLDSPRVAILDAGVGPAVRQALSLGASSITALQANPQLYELSCESQLRARDAVCDSRHVSWHIQSARAFLAGNRDSFDLISLTAETDAAGLDALRTDFDLTREAVVIYLRHLSASGLLVIEGPTRLPPRLSLRMLDTVRAALKEIGIDKPTLHIAMIRGWQRFVLLASSAPLGTERETAVRSFSKRLGFDLVWLPNITPAEINRFQQLTDPLYHLGAAAILEERNVAEAVEGRFRLQPATDNMPFPNRFSRWTELWSALLYGDRTDMARLDTGLLVGTVTVALVSLAGIVLILVPLFWLGSSDARLPANNWIRGRTFAYFGLVGIAFLLMEVAWIQRLQLFLGHPVYATTAVLVAFLVFAGLGSLWSQKYSQGHARRLLVAAILTILLFSLVYFFFLSPWLMAASHLSLATRVSITLALLAPLAFAMGIPFPTGLRELGGTSRGLIPWAWGINGCTSVASAAGAPLLAMEIGLDGLIAIAVLAYLALSTIHLDNGQAT